MSAYITVTVLSLLVALAVLALAAYPHRRRRIPGPPPVSRAVDRVGSKVTRLLEDASSPR